MAICLWYDKDLKDVAEHEQENCAKVGLECEKCSFLEADKEREDEERDGR